jgi:hypothetical protein
VSFFCLELLDDRDFDELFDERDFELLPLLDDLDLLLEDRRPLPDLFEERVLLDLDLELWVAISPPGS